MTADPSPASDDSNRQLTRRSALVAGLGAAAIPALSGCVTITRDRSTATEQHSVRAEPLSAVAITGTDGDITVSATETETVAIEARKRATGETSLSDLTVHTRVEGDHLDVETEIPTGDLLGGGQIDLRMEVPADLSVERVRTADGDIRLENTAGETRVESVDGDIHATGTGPLDLDVESGDITVQTARGPVAASATDGDIQLREPDALGDISVTDGDVTADLSAIAGDAQVETVDGDIVLRVGPDLDARIEASTRNGEVAGIDGLDEVETATRTALEGTIGRGTHALVVTAIDGDIHLRAR